MVVKNHDHFESNGYFLHFLLPFLMMGVSFAQLAPSESRILLQLQQLLEYPPVLHGWTNWTNFCYLPPSTSLTIVCSGNHITELTVVGNMTSPSINGNTLSHRFSIDSFFTSLTKLSSLKVLTLVSLGLWGSLPAKINRFYSLQVLNISSNSIYGEIPPEVNMMTELRSLVLANSLFNGSVPVLSKLAVLQELDLSSNRLGPEFPSLGNKLVRVVLRNNVFRSHIPSNLQMFGQLQYLDISLNQFFGPIPSKWFSLPSIHYLNFTGNKLNGSLSTKLSCSGGLEFVDLSHNYLTGKLPLCIGSNSSNRVVLYSWNCLSTGDLRNQHSHSFCHEEALIVKPTTKDHKNKPTKKLAIILTISGIIVLAVVAAVLLLLVLLRRGKRKKTEVCTLEKSVSRKSSALLSPKLPTEARHVSPSTRFRTMGLRAYHAFSMDELEEATNNFKPSNLMGEGPQGQLYRACLRDGLIVVVRCMKLKQKHSSQRLLQHMEVISNLRHRNLVSILGHCIDTHHDYPNGANTIYLVFEHVSNSTLRTHLTERRKRELLKWPQRSAITMGVAKGIQFLHTGIVPGIFGNDVKIENILLDQNLTAKICNYNLLILTKAGSESPLISRVEPPDNFGSSMRSHEHGEREDVYQLGAILLEVITGKSITCQSELDVQRLEMEQSLADSPWKLREMVDPSMRGSYAYESVRTTAGISINCLSKDPAQRPTIEDVIWNLQYSVQVQDGWTISSENLSTK